MLEGDESTFQQQKHDPNKITKPAEEEWDQLNLRLANYEANRRRMVSIELTISKLYSKRSSKVASQKVRWTCLIHPKNFPKFKSFFPILILELQVTKLDETWIQGSPQHKEYILKRGFSQIQIFSFWF
jgi:hypothetical protein